MPDQPAVGSDRQVVDTVVDLMGRGSYRNARLQLAAHERRSGLVGVAELVSRITTLSTTVDPRTESLALSNLPPHLPEWLVQPTRGEIVRICARQAMPDRRVDTLLGRILAASIVDESVPGHLEPDDFAHRAHMDLRDDAPTDADVVDVSDPARRPATPLGPVSSPDRTFTDWLARRA